MEEEERESRKKRRSSPENNNNDDDPIRVLLLPLQLLSWAWVDAFVCGVGGAFVCGVGAAHGPQAGHHHRDWTNTLHADFDFAGAWAWAAGQELHRACCRTCAYIGWFDFGGRPGNKGGSTPLGILLLQIR